MKKIIAAFLCLAVLLLSGCGGAPAAQPTPTPTPEPTPAPTPTPTPTPSTSSGVVVTLEACAVLVELERGEQVQIEGEWEAYYIVDSAAGRGFVEKRLLAKDGEAEFAPWTAYAKSQAAFYTSYYLSGAPERVLDTNTELEVLADLGDCYLVSLDGALGYVPADMVSASRIEYRDWGSGGGGGGGTSSGGVDGGDISLGAYVDGAIPAVSIAHYPGQYSGNAGGSARVIAASAELLAAICQRGDEVRVYSDDEDACVLYMDGLFATVPRRCLLLEGEQPYESRTAYAVSGAEVYGSIYLRGEADKLDRNTELTLLADLGDCYLASLADERLGYIACDQVSDEPIVYSDYGGGGGGGSSSGGEWTEPVL